MDSLFIHISEEQKRAMDESSAWDRNPPHTAGIKSLIVGNSEIDAKTVFDCDSPPLMYPDRDAFHADFAVLHVPVASGGCEALGWLDRRGFREAVKRLGVGPGERVVIPADWLRPMSTMPLLQRPRERRSGGVK